MKRNWAGFRLWFSAFLVLTLLLPLAAAAPEASAAAPKAVSKDTALNVTVGTVAVNAGSTGTVDVYVNGYTGANGLGAYDVRIGFDITKVIVTAVGAGDSPFGTPTNNVGVGTGKCNTTGQLTMNAFHTSIPGPTGNIKIATVTWQGILGGTHALTTTITTLSDTSGADVTGAVPINGSVIVWQTPAASFTESATSIVLGTAITFTDTSAGPAQTWAWNFGDGTGSSSQNPSKTYAASGTYTVTLYITNPMGNSTATATKYVYAVPVASFTESATNVVLGTAINFTDTSTGPPQSWSWNFGDGTGSSSQNPSKTYAAAGNYTVTLVVTNMAGSASATAVKHVYATPVASFIESATNIILGPPGSPPVQAPVVLGSASAFVVLAGSTVTSTGATIVNGDLGLSPGSAVTGFPPGIVNGAQHVSDPIAAQAKLDLTAAYNDAAGRTLAPVTVSGNLGGQTLTPGLYKSTSSLEISSGDLTLDAQGNANAVFIFQMASTLTTTSGRQVILTGNAQAANIFWQVGSSATLGTTSIFKGTILADQSITLNTGAILEGRALARIGAVSLSGNTVTKPAATAINFTDTSTGNIQTWAWNFGDGTGSSTQNPTKTYTAAGNYTVTLLVTNMAGSSTATAVKHVYAVPVASFTESATSVVLGTPITFTDTSTGNIQTWSWNFGDGTGSSSQNPSHTYAAYGNYTVTLTVSNLAAPGGVSATAVKHVYTTPVASFTESATSIVLGTPITFTDTSTPVGNIQTWLWTFGDGTTSTLQNPSKTYTAAGNYTVTLTVSNLAGYSTATAVKHVYAAPTASFTESASNVVLGTAITFTDTSTGNIQTWSWNFGDGTTSTLQNPSKTYTAAGNYTVSLVVANMAGTSAPATAVKHVYALPVASFTESATSVVLGTPITFTDTSTGNIQTWSWNFGDGTGSSLQNPSKTYTAAGNYTVTLLVTNMAGSSTATAVKHVYAVPVANFTASPTSTNPLTPISFTDTSTGNIQSWLWNFGDSTTSTLQNPNKSYADDGTYDVTLTVTNIAGTDGETKVGYIVIVSYKAETAITQGLAGGYAYFSGNINRFFNPVTGETVVLADGLGAYDAYMSYLAAGVNVKAAATVAPFNIAAQNLNTESGTKSNINGFQTGGTPQPPAELFRLFPWLTGSRLVPYTVTLHFTTVARSGGGSVPQNADATKTFRRGDAQQNGIVNITDALFIAQYLASLRAVGEATGEVFAVNAATAQNNSATLGSSITITDALFIAQLLAGLRDDSYNFI